MNYTPLVRQYIILNSKWGALLCQKDFSHPYRSNMRLAETFPSI